MHVDPESGFGHKDDDNEKGQGPEIVVPAPTRDYGVPELVLEAMRGEMRLTRPLKPWEPSKLTPTHIQMLFDRSMGFKNHELAEKYEMDPSRVSVILGHPYAERIMGAIFATLSERVADPIERMRGHAHEMVDIKLEIVRDKATPKFLKDKIASDWLDRIGYGARKQLEITDKRSPAVPTEAMSRLAEALNEARKAPKMDYQRYLRNFGRQEGQDSTLDLSDEDSGINPSQSGEASLTSPPQPPDSEERVA